MPPVDGATPEPTATATPLPTATPAPEPVVTKSGTPLDITRQGGVITFPTTYDVCEDWTLEWDCLTDDGVTTCTPGVLGSGGAVGTVTVVCMNHDNPLVMEEFTGAVQ